MSLSRANEATSADAMSTASGGNEGGGETDDAIRNTEAWFTVRNRNRNRDDRGRGSDG